MVFESCMGEVPDLRNGTSSAVEARLAYQDDSNLLGKAGDLASLWPALTGALAAGGHRVRNHKCQVRAPRCDHLDDSLPFGIKNLLVPRKCGGIQTSNFSVVRQRAT